MVTRDQALAAAAEGLAVLAVEKQRTGGDPETDAQFDALLGAAALIASDTPDHS
ncbi:hypothetical protein [Streptomyces zaomyceticus]|uniref:hypothetical protein n=1 Tax=Streptomyces zaomyceticus TaxID=68286 RepID=UPI002E0FA760|nr:hypothetical protein OG237_06490 [Streptomyces zaomyceticus]